MWLRKKPSPAIEFVTGERRAQEQFPPRPAAQFVPEWWRKTPLQAPAELRKHPTLCLRSELTIKGCPGVQDYLSSGYILPLWSDYVVTVNERGFSWDTPDERIIETFDPVQWDTCPRPEGESQWVLKLRSPWCIVTPPGWSTLLLPTWFHRDERFSIMPGVVDTDRHSPIIVVMTWRCPVGEPQLLRAGSPLVQLVPFPRQRHQDHRIVLDAERSSVLQAFTNEQINNRLAPGAYREDGRLAQ
jgi:hypothetical protein